MILKLSRVPIATLLLALCYGEARCIEPMLPPYVKIESFQMLDARRGLARIRCVPMFYFRFESDACLGYRVRWHKAGAVVLEEEFKPATSPLINLDDKGHDFQIRIPKEDGDYSLSCRPLFREKGLSNYANEWACSINVGLHRNPAALLYLTAAVLAPAAVILLVLALLLRRRFRLHLSTCLSMLLAAAVLLAINASERFTTYEYSVGSQAFYSIRSAPGWPWPVWDNSGISSALCLDAVVFLGIVAVTGWLSEFLFARKASPLPQPVTPNP